MQFKLPQNPTFGGLGSTAAPSSKAASFGAALGAATGGNAASSMNLAALPQSLLGPLNKAGYSGAALAKLQSDIKATC